MQVREVILAAQRGFAGFSDTPRLDAQVLLGHIAGRSRAWIMAHSEAELSPEQALTLSLALQRVEAGEPLPYLLGRQAFFGLDFAVTQDTLIPRPETELLVERALEWLRANASRRLAADVGTGSGCISVSLVHEISDLTIFASDLSLPALRVARQNARTHGVAGRVFFQQADLFPASRQRFDLITANLPYIPSRKLPGLRVSAFEPRLALDGGPDGLGVIARLLEKAPDCLAPGGLILLEIEAGQGAAAQAVAHRAFPEAQVQIFKDLAGHDRVVSIQAMQ
ncbi:MAG TPA: peptide chain release factor N(5)-glutamine methyltransferase [Anaerolineales bacterium]|nr:peptide chain release factor N(5)-glutamine methyltransferase [Anaerolineales bacterium]